MSDAAPDFPLPLGTLLPLISQAEPRGINDFAPLWSGEAAALASDLPGERLTLELAKGAIERFRQLGCGANAGPPRARGEPTISPNCLLARMSQN